MRARIHFIHKKKLACDIVRIGDRFAIPRAQSLIIIFIMKWHDVDTLATQEFHFLVALVKNYRFRQSGG